MPKEPSAGGAQDWAEFHGTATAEFQGRKEEVAPEDGL